MDISELIRAVQTLKSEDAFTANFSAEQWRALELHLTRREIAAGDLLIKQDDLERTMYFLEQGSLHVYVNANATGPRRLAILRAGAIVGEAGLLGGCPRMANVEAMTPCAVWALTLPHLDELALRAPTLAYELVRGAGAVLAVRLRANMLQSIAVS